MKVTQPPWHFWLTSSLALIFSACFLYWSIQWIGRPFPGFLVLRTGQVDMTLAPDWTGAKAGIRVGDRPIGVDGQRFASPSQFYDYVAASPAGTLFKWEVRREAVLAGRRIAVLEVPSQTYAWRTWRQTILAYWLPGIIHLLSGIVVMLLRPGDRAARAHWYWCLALGGFLTSCTDNTMGFHLLSSMGDAGAVFIGLAGMNLATHLPRPWPVFQRYPAWRTRLVTAGLLAAVGLVVVAVGFGSYVASTLGVVVGAAGILVLLSSTVWTLTRRDSTHLQRTQATVICLGALLAYVPGMTVSLAGQLFGLTLFTPDIGVFMISLFPVAVAVAIVRHQLFDITVVIRRATLYAALLTCLGAVYIGATALGTVLFGNWFLAVLPTGMAGVAGAFAVALVFRPLQQMLRRHIDRIFLGERADALQVLGDFGRIAPGDPAEIAHSLLALIAKALQPAWAVILASGGTLASAGSVPETVGVQVFRRPPADFGPLSGFLAQADDRALYVLLASPSGGASLLLLGPRQNEMPYTSEEQGLLKALAVRGAVALENARIRSEHAEQLVQEGIARSLAEERRQVLRQVLHDLRSDLMNIALTVDIAKNRPGNDESLAAIRESTARIERFLNEKAPGQASAGDHRAPVAAAMQTTARVLGEALRQKGQTLSLTLPVDDLAVALTPLELEQILTNLVGNAGKFAPPQTAIQLTARALGDQVAITVVDEGPGIPEDLLDQLGSGVRADATVPGLGFGLQNVEALAAKAGGSLAWRNGDQGAVVTVVAPAVRRQ